MKKGISLIVLVITIIVMIIIAGAIIISLNSSNVIAKSNEAVVKTDVGTINDKLTLAYVDLRTTYPTVDNYDYDGTTAADKVTVKVGGVDQTYSNLVAYYAALVPELAKIGTGNYANYEVQYYSNGSAWVVEKTPGQN